MNYDNALLRSTEATQHVQKMEEKYEQMVQLADTYNAEMRENEKLLRKEEVKAEALMDEGRAWWMAAKQLKMDANKAEAKKAEAKKAEAKKAEAEVEALEIEARNILKVAREKLEKSKKLALNAHKAVEEARAALDDAKKKQTVASTALSRASPCNFVGSLRDEVLSIPVTFLEANPNFVEALKSEPFFLEYMKDNGEIARCPTGVVQSEGSWCIKACPSWRSFALACGVGVHDWRRFRFSWNGDSVFRVDVIPE